jgi:hypothetical protein
MSLSIELASYQRFYIYRLTDDKLGDLKMSGKIPPPPKKMVSRSIAITLGIVCVLLVAGLGGAIAYYTRTIDNKNSDYSSLQNEYNNLTSTYNDYTSTHSHTDTDYNSLQTEYNSMWNPLLITIGMSAVWQGHFLSPPTLNSNGYVVNVHNNWAYNCQLLVVAYGLGGVLMINESIPMGTIAGQGYYQVSEDIAYSSGSISSYTLTPIWTATP